MSVRFVGRGEGFVSRDCCGQASTAEIRGGSAGGVCVWRGNGSEGGGGGAAAAAAGRDGVLPFACLEPEPKSDEKKDIIGVQ